MLNFPMPDTCRLHNAGTGVKELFAVTLVLESNPAPGHVHHLKIELMPVPFALGVPAGYCSYDMGAELAVGGGAHAEGPILKKTAQTLGLKLAFVGVTD